MTLGTGWCAFRSILAAVAVAPALLCGCLSEGPTTTEPSEKIVFEDSFSTSGQFRVYEQPDGRLGLSVGGRIDVEDMAAVRGHLEPSLVRTYLGLRPDVAAAPAALVSLEERYQRQLASMPTSPPPPTETSQIGSGPTPHDSNTFYAWACQNLYWSSCHADYWYPYSCGYYLSALGICAPHFNPYEVSFGWNVDGAADAQHSVYDPTINVKKYSRTIPQGYFYWNSWAQEPRFNYVCIDTNAGHNTALGITVHKFHQSGCGAARDACMNTCESGDEDCVSECKADYTTCCG